MTQSEIEDELGQHNDQLKLQDEAISEIHRQTKLVIELWRNLEICGFTTTLHSHAGTEARKRISEIVNQLQRRD